MINMIREFLERREKERREAEFNERIEALLPKIYLITQILAIINVSLSLVHLIEKHAGKSKSS